MTTINPRLVWVAWDLTRARLRLAWHLMAAVSGDYGPAVRSVVIARAMQLDGTTTQPHGPDRAPETDRSES